MPLRVGSSEGLGLISCVRLNGFELSNALRQSRSAAALLATKRDLACLLTASQNSLQFKRGPLGLPLPDRKPRNGLAIGMAHATWSFQALHSKQFQAGFRSE